MNEVKSKYIRKSFSFLIKIKGSKIGLDRQYISYPSSHFDENEMTGDEYMASIVPNEVIMINGVFMNCSEIYSAAIKAIEANIKEQYVRATPATEKTE